MIRSLKIEDITEILPLITMVYNQHQEQIPYFMPPLEDTRILVERLNSMIELKGFYQFVYEEKSKIVAYMDVSIHKAHLDLLFPSEDTIFLDTLIVHPDHRRRGIADTMIGYAKDFSTELGFQTLQLVALTNFPHLPKFYGKFGFKNMAQLMVCELQGRDE